MEHKHQIREILKSFDFEKVAKVIRILGPEHFGLRKTPSSDRLKEIAHICLIEALKNKGPFDGIYGLEADYVGGGLELRFTIQKSNILSKLFAASKQTKKR